jgi:hypothetical protein
MFRRFARWVSAFCVVGLGSVAYGQAEIPPTPAVTIQYMTDELWPAFAAAAPIIAGIMIVFWVWRSIKRAAGQRGGAKL